MQAKVFDGENGAYDAIMSGKVCMHIYVCVCVRERERERKRERERESVCVGYEVT